MAGRLAASRHRARTAQARPHRDVCRGRSARRRHSCTQGGAPAERGCPQRVVTRGGCVSSKQEALLADEAPIAELEEFRSLITEGQERGYLTFEEIAVCLEEVEVTKEQVSELHTYLTEH